ncbi:hypothetical protein ACFL1M_01460 [Patescibacteria group bacterium]
MHFLFAVFVSIIFALLEIQIEGDHGWAKNLPTWKINNPLKKITHWPHITGYHVYMFSLLFILLHFPYFLGLEPTYKNELTILQTYFLIITFEDFLWFVFNPKWGLKNFFKNTIKWHPKRVLKLPIPYWVSLVVIVFLQSLHEIK